MPDTPQLTESEVNEIEARANAATEGPWVYFGEPENNVFWGEIRSAAEDGHFDHIADTSELDERGNDMEFIAHARTDIPALIRDWRAMRARIETLTTDWCECGHAKDKHGFFSDHDECYDCDQTSPDLCCEWRSAPRPNENAALRQQLAQPPMCEVHAALDRSDKLILEIGNDCVACSLHERTALLSLLEPFAAEDGSQDSLTVLRSIIASAASSPVAPSLIPNNEAAIALLDKWLKEHPEVNSDESLERLLKAINDNSLSDRPGQPLARVAAEEDHQRMLAAFTAARASLDPDSKWTAGDVSNLSALFFAGWNARAAQEFVRHFAAATTDNDGWTDEEFAKLSPELSDEERARIMAESKAAASEQKE